MIRSFTGRDTEQLFRTERNRRFNAIARVALRKLIQMNRAGRVSDLAVPPGENSGFGISAFRNLSVYPAPFLPRNPLQLRPSGAPSGDP